MSKQLSFTEWQARHKTGASLGMFDWTLPRITVAGCLDTIRDLAHAGSKPTNLKLAAWAGAMSIKQKLSKNGDAARILARFVDAELPQTEAGIKALLKPARCGIMPVHTTALLAIERAAREGSLPEVPQDDWSLDKWLAWRRDMTAIDGIGLKVASFIGLLCCPETCPLVPVDMWVMRRLGYDSDSAPDNEAHYAGIEAEIMAERDAAGYGSLPLGAWHWYKWSQARQACGPNIEVASVKPESHDALSPRDY